MKLRSARIRNFRCIREAEINFEDITNFIGGNGSGKSTVLRAIDTFYAGAPKLVRQDFFDRDMSVPIEIDLTFHSLTPAELEMFGGRVNNDELSVVRVFDGEEARTGRYFGTSLQCPDFRLIRAKSGLDKRRAYSELRTQRPEYGLSAVTQVAQVDAELIQWERNHPERCVRERDDGQFFGFTNNANGKLQRATSFVFVPAVRDAAADATDAGRAPIARLMELVVRSAIERRAEVRAFRERISEQYRQLMDPANLPELGTLAGELSGTLKDFYENATVNLRWQEIGNIDAPPPNAEVELEEDSFRSPVDRTGHGLQRAFVLSLLQHLALASSRTAENEDTDGGEAAESPTTTPLLPGLILAIEEPELYQHPTKQRHFANVLSRLANGELPGVARQMQIAIATHSPLFVRLDSFQSVRLARRVVREEGKPREAIIREPTALRVCTALEEIHGVQAGTFTPAGLLPRLHIMNSEVCEGFFANVAVLVEGVSDRAAILATARAEGLDFEAEGIAVIACGAANNIDRPAMIFRELGIPTYIVWDADKGAKPEQVKRNRSLQRLIGIAESDVVDVPVLVGTWGTAFHADLETTIAEEIGSTMLLQLRSEQIELLELEDSRRALKVPACMEGVIRAANAAGVRSTTLVGVVRAIASLRQTSILPLSA
ncbi:ATP-dependent nuclease [Reyranella massiliensis]|uniref:ATP-dependent nuclease n=1 Tax=Reyranella massiliensis TaxID=445220 RepID=UPI000317F30A|nr:AAA family ATPase [Reyranella massiliensis]